MKIPSQEHPKPQFMRTGFLNLNGPWQFEIDNGWKRRGSCMIGTPKGRPTWVVLFS